MSSAGLRKKPPSRKPILYIKSTQITDMKYPAILVLPILLFACGQPQTANPPDFLAINIDSGVKPSQDFFLYANGGWIKRTPIPSAESGWSIGDLVQEDIYARLKKINDDAQGQPAAPGSIAQKIGDFWYSGMDTADINKQGLAPLRADLDSIDRIQSREDLVHATARLHRIGIRSLFSDGVGQDDKNSDQMAFGLNQGGLGMPNRDYYFNKDSRTQGVRRAYQIYLYKTFRELGADSLQAGLRADRVYQLESKLAKASRKLADLRDPYANYHKMSIPALRSLSANFDWPIYLHNIGISHLDSVIVGQPEFYSALSHELQSTPMDTWKDYLRCRLIANSAAFLDSLTFANQFAYTKSLSGADEPRMRWKRVLDAEEAAMGEALGQLFVKQYFSDTAKRRYTAIVDAIRNAYRERITRLSWMSDSTKQRAYNKLATLTRKVGYPDKWKDFSALQIDRGPYVLNVQHANEWWHNYRIAKLGKPVDRTEWDMTPQTYNAYYNPSNNEIVLPAGIFAVPGKRDEELDDAFVYGYAAASTIGHEMTHGFDDQGRQYDSHGNLRGWWQPRDSVEFVKRAKKIIQEFNEFNPVDTLHVNGNACQGENIADLGGLLLGLDAFKKTAAYQQGEKIGGFTPLQRYFLGYAYGWLEEDRKERLAAQVMTDVHAPAKERVNGPVVNIAEFYEAFGVKPGDKMYRPDSLRVSIW
jgi:putative endopeptidase